jgi:hypothetical protein
MLRCRGRFDQVRTIIWNARPISSKSAFIKIPGSISDRWRGPSSAKLLEGNWRKIFRTQTRHAHSNSVALWERLHLNVPGICEVYVDYVERLCKNGVARKAIDIERGDRLRR